MFFRVKIEKYIWLCSIFRLKPVAENIVLEFLATHFIDVKVKFDLLIFGIYLYIIYTFDISLHDMSIGRWVDKWNYFQRFKTGSFLLHFDLLQPPCSSFFKSKSAPSFFKYHSKTFVSHANIPMKNSQIMFIITST